MFTENKELLFAFLVAAGVLLVLVTFIVLIMALHSRKMRKVAIEKKSLQTEFEKNLLKSKLEVEEQTRRDISRDLHDNIGALSSVIKINLNLLSTETSDDKRTQLLNDSRLLIKTLIAEVKQLSVTLNADRLSNMGLVGMIQLNIERLRKLNLFNLVLTVEGDEQVLSPDRQIILFRIVQELLHNCLKHANASEVLVHVKFLSKDLMIEVRDDGVGFDNTSTLGSSLDGSGLKNIRARIEILNGTFDIVRTEGRYTSCRINLPVKNEL